MNMQNIAKRSKHLFVVIATSAVSNIEVAEKIRIANILSLIGLLFGIITWISIMVYIMVVVNESNNYD